MGKDMALQTVEFRGPVHQSPSPDCHEQWAPDWTCVIKDVFNALYDLKGNEGTLLAMSARNEEKDIFIVCGYFRGRSKIKLQSVVCLAGGAAMMAIVAQPYRGHLNGNVNDEFDMECYEHKA